MLAHGHAHGVQQCDLAPATCDRERLRGIDEEGAGKQRHQRERREIGAIGARQPHSIVGRLARRDDLRARWQQRAITAARTASRSALWLQPQVDAIEPTQALQPPLRFADVEQADGRPVRAGRQQPRHAQADPIERHLHIQVVAHCRSSICAAAGLSQSEFSASRPCPAARPSRRPQPARAPVAAREMDRCRSASGSARGPAAAPAPRPRGSRRPRPAVRAMRGNRASSRPPPGAWTERSARPNSERDAPCTSSAATRLIR